MFGVASESRSQLRAGILSERTASAQGDLVLGNLVIGIFSGFHPTKRSPLPSLPRGLRVTALTKPLSRWLTRGRLAANRHQLQRGDSTFDVSPWTRAGLRHPVQIQIGTTELETGLSPRAALSRKSLQSAGLVGLVIFGCGALRGKTAGCCSVFAKWSSVVDLTG